MQYMAVRIIKKSWWVDIRFARQRYRRRSPENTRAGAVAYEALLRGRLVRGESVDIESVKKTPKFRGYAESWLNTYVINNNKPSEQDKKESILRIHLNPFFGKISIDKITTHKVEVYKATKIKKYNPKTINNQLAVLGKCLRCAYDELEIETKFPEIKPNKLIDPTFTYLSEEECSLLLKHADEIWKDMILVALKTGLRLGELLALDWNDINLESKVISVRRSMYKGSPGPTKSHKVRAVSLTEDVVKVLSVRSNKKGYVFPDEKGEALKDHRAARNIHRICDLAGIRRVRWHVLRHSFSSHLAMAGVSMRIIQDLLGHSSSRMTMRYVHLSPHTFEDAINKLNLTDFNELFGHYVGNQDKVRVKTKKRKHDSWSNFR